MYKEQKLVFKEKAYRMAYTIVYEFSKRYRPGSKIYLKAFQKFVERHWGRCFTNDHIKSFTRDVKSYADRIILVELWYYKYAKSQTCIQEYMAKREDDKNISQITLQEFFLYVKQKKIKTYEAARQRFYIPKKMHNAL